MLFTISPERQQEIRAQLALLGDWNVWVRAGNDPKEFDRFLRERGGWEDDGETLPDVIVEGGT